MRAAWAGLLSVLSLGGLAVAASTATVPQSSTDGLAVIFAPWTSSDEALRRAVAAGARFVRHGGVPFIAVVMPDDDAYAARVRGAGAWLIADPRALAACFRASANGDRRS